MDEFKDLLGNSIEIGDTVIVQDSGRLGLGRVSHVSAVGNLIIKERLSSNFNGIKFTRIIRSYNSEDKVIVTNDHTHISAAHDIKIRGE